MEWSKVKNIIILILLAVNVFLLVQTAGRDRQSRQYREEALSGAVEVLRRQGYEVSPAALQEEKDLQPLAAERDKDSETRLAENLLGAVEKKDDSVRVSYTGEKGECSFRGDGSFAFAFSPGTYTAEEGDEGAYTEKLLSKAGYSCAVIGTAETAEGRVVTVRQTWENAPVFSCTAKATYRSGALVSIEGVRLVGTPVPDGGGGQAMDVPTALIRFMSSMREGGHVFTRVEALTAGYQTSSSGRRFQLEPTWSVSTDAGVFLMDGVTGEIHPE